MNINLHIERLVLEGVAPGQLPRLQSELKAEFHLLLQAGGLSRESAPGAATAQVEAQPMRIGANRAAGDIGRQIARLLYAGLMSSDSGPALTAHSSARIKPVTTVGQRSVE